MNKRRVQRRVRQDTIPFTFFKALITGAGLGVGLYIVHKLGMR